MVARPGRPYRDARSHRSSTASPTASGDDTGSTESFESSGEDEDEEKAVGRGLARRTDEGTLRSLGKGTHGGQRTWVMRSQGKASGSSPHDDAYLDTKTPPLSSDDGEWHDKDQGYSDESDAGAKKRGKKRGGAGAGDGQDGKDGQQDDEALEVQQNKKWWWLAGAAAILVVILLASGIWWLTNSDSSDDSSSSTASSVRSSSSTSSSGSSSSSSSSSSATATESTVSPSTSSPSIARTDLTSPTYTRQAVQATPRPTPSTTLSALDPDTTYFAQIKWFYAEDDLTECKTKPRDSDFVVKVSPELYGSVQGVSSLCGKWITLYQLERDSYTRATIEGVCSTCTGHNLLLSKAVFTALTQNLKLGTTLAQFWVTDEAHEPKGSLKSYAAEAAVTSGGRTPSVAIGAFEEVDGDDSDGPLAV
ncbi:hypothetical protein JCM3770_004347 [Rhodotorula araucariae]